MKSWKLTAIAAVMSWIALNSEEAGAQVYNGYPPAAPHYRSYVPTSLSCGYGVPSGYGRNGTYGSGAYGNNRAYPAGVPSSLYPANNILPVQYGRPADMYPQSGYGAPVLSQPAGGYGVPVYYPTGATQQGVPVNRPVFPSAGHFSVEDPFPASPTTTQYGLSPGSLPASPANSPFYQNPGTISPTGGYTPASNYPTGPAISAPANDSPFYR